MLQTFVQWLIFLPTLLLFAVAAFFNASIAWRIWVRRETDGPSTAPLIGGLIGMVAVLAAPFGELSQRLPFLWVPLLLDYGSGPYFLMVVYYLLRGGRG